MELKIDFSESHIRKRPGMYIGNIGIFGFKNMMGHLLEEIKTDQSKRTQITIKFQPNYSFHIQMNNAEIPMFFEQWEDKTLEPYFGFRCLVHLTELLELKTQNKTSLISLIGKGGNFNYNITQATDNTNTIDLWFKIDLGIFRDLLNVDYSEMNQFLRRYSFLNPLYKIVTIDNRSSDKPYFVFDFPQGISHELDFKLNEQHLTPIFRMDLKVTINNYAYQVSFAYTSENISTRLLTYTNYVDLLQGNSLERGVLDGLILGFKRYFQLKEIKTQVNTKKIKNQLILIAHLSGEEIEWRGATKTNIYMPHIRKDIKYYIAEKLTDELMGRDNLGKQMKDIFDKA